MSTNRTSNIVNGISKGFLRIGIVVSLIIVAIGGWFAFDSTVYFDAAYRFDVMSNKPIRVDSCSPEDKKIDDWSAQKTPKGGSVNIAYCFATIEIVNKEGKSFIGVPYKKIQNGDYYVAETVSKYGYGYGDNYVKELIKNFSIPPEDIRKLDERYWQKKFINIGEGIAYLLVVLLGWIGFCLVVRFIWRGFVNKD